MEMEKRINSQEQEEDVIDLMEIARLLLHNMEAFVNCTFGRSSSRRRILCIFA